ncbi:hypothetical protein FHS81_002746 [Pseudochelatococcus contaminans]|uniref:Uncharacterized protein n=1 Tax=Pseudochelatococcus contaminans TaxID=1538103 RepID=A0A7W5Z609_9HYPH|nr:hypothetical protein [Pseudochelatococcus contaminans]
MELRQLRCIVASARNRRFRADVSGMLAGEEVTYH